MRDLLSDEYDSVAGRPTEELVPASLRRIAGAVLFLGVIGAMGLWSYRLGTRDANEVPVIKAMAGPARVAPEDPGGARAAHQGLEVNSVLAGNQPDPTGIAPAAPEPVALADEDAAEGDLVIVAGKGHEQHQEVAGRLLPFDDRVVVQEEYERLQGGHT